MAAHLIESLWVTGFGATAASGYAYFYQPNTLTPVSVYSNDAATTVVTQPVRLDANGRSSAPLYVKVPARAIIQNSSGATLVDIERIDGDRAELVASVNPLWPNEPSQDAVNTALALSLGGTDGNIKVVGAGAIGRSAQSKLSEQLSVKDFGAKGDGIADDTAAIRAALAAAATLGTFFVLIPFGSYVVTSTITVPLGVSIVGQGSPSLIDTAGSVTPLVIMSGVTGGISGGIQSISGVQFTPGAQVTGSAISVTGNAVVISSCVFGSSAFNTYSNPIKTGPSNQFVTIAQCNITYQGGAAARGLVLSTTGGDVRVLNNAFNPASGTGATDIEITGATSRVIISGNTTAIQSATSVLINSAHTGANVIITGNYFGAALTISRLTGLGLVEYGNTWLTGITDSSDGATNVITSSRLSTGQLSRPVGGFAYSTTIGGTTGFTPDLTRGDRFEIIATGAGSTITINAPAATPLGASLKFMCKNNSGGAVTWTFNAAYVTSATVNPSTGTRTNVTFANPGGGTSFYEETRATVTG